MCIKCTNDVIFVMALIPISLFPIGFMPQLSQYFLQSLSGAEVG